jgi:hypothetical protein
MVRYRLIVARGLTFGPPLLRVRQKKYACDLDPSDRVSCWFRLERARTVVKAGLAVLEDEVPEDTFPG